MSPALQRFAASFPLVLLTVLVANCPASALTAELAKKCQALASKAHPPAPIGAKTGTAQAHLEFYRTCIANDGTMPENGSQKTSAPAGK